MMTPRSRSLISAIVQPVRCNSTGHESRSERPLRPADLIFLTHRRAPHDAFLIDEVDRVIGVRADEPARTDHVELSPPYEQRGVNAPRINDCVGISRVVRPVNSRGAGGGAADETRRWRSSLRTGGE